MAITLVSGVPRSGKSYYSVHKINRLLQESIPHLIVTNIEGLNIEDPRLIHREFKTEDFDNSRMSTYIAGLRKEYGLTPDDKIYFFIDEAQRYLSNSLKDSQVIYFFDYHAHYNIELFLIAQNSVKLSKGITCLAEYEFRAVSNSINPLPVFRYKVSHQGEVFETKSLKKEQEVFALYKSQHGGKPARKNKKLPVMIFLFFLVFGGGIFLLFDRIGKGFGVHRPRPLQHMNNIVSPPIPEQKNLVKPIPGQAEMVRKETPSLCPVPEKYIPSQDLVVYDDPDLGVLRSSVRDYVKKFDPMLYGYGYVHVPGEKFILLSSLSTKILFPTDYELPQKVRGAPSSPGRIHRGQGADGKAPSSRSLEDDRSRVWQRYMELAERVHQDNHGNLTHELNPREYVEFRSLRRQLDAQAGG